MRGQRLRRRIINRPWHHSLQRFKTQAVFSIIVMISVAIGVWNLQHEKLKPPATGNSGTVAKTYKKHFTEGEIFSKTMQKMLSGSPSLWTNHILDGTCCLLFPAFVLLMVGPRNLKRFFCIMVESFCGIYKRTSCIVHGVNLFLLFTFTIIAYAYLVMLYMVCAGLLGSKIFLSVAEVQQVNPVLQNRIQYSEFRDDLAPYFNAKVTRYDMEDVVMTCTLKVVCKENIPTIVNSFRWIKDGRAVSKTDKMHITTYAYKYTGYFSRYCDKFLIVAKLGLEVVDSADYGKYSCEYTRAKLPVRMIIPIKEVPFYEGMGSALPHDGYIPYSPPKKRAVQDKLGEVTTEIFGNFDFQRQTRSLQEVNILPGGLFIEHVPYWSLADHVDITINETISGNDNTDCCQLPIWFYTFLFGYRSLVSKEKLGLCRQRFLLRQQCVCSENFTLKDFVFTRTRYNSTSKNKQDIQVHYPEHFKLVFGVPKMFKMAPENDEHEPVITAREFLLYGMAQFLAAFIIVLIVLWFCLRCIFEVICLPLINCLKDLFLVEHQWQGYDYDLYLTYDENDRYALQLTQELKERFDINTCRVFDAWTDVPPGYPLLDERLRAIGNSRRFCVIMSDESANDGEKVLEFTAIKQTLADRKAAGTETEDCKFVIQIGNCASDGLLSPENVVVSQHFRENNTLDDSELRKFSKWAICLNRQVSFCHLMKSYGFSLNCSVLVIITTIVFVTCVFYSEALLFYHVWSIEKERRKFFYEAEG